MSYSIDFYRASKKELYDYRDWFEKTVPTRILALTGAVKNTRGFEGWDPDLTPESLDQLGEWLQGQVKTRLRTKEELDRISADLNFQIDFPDWELTDESFSHATDVGLYFGQVVIANVPGTRWEQLLKGRRSIDYGQVLVFGAGTVPLNPIRIATTVAYGFAHKKLPGDQPRKIDGDGLHKAFNIWAINLQDSEQPGFGKPHRNR